MAVADITKSAHHLIETAARGATDTPPVEVTGSAGGNAALENLLTALESLGFITDNTS